jgi:hypothetical protein
MHYNMTINVMCTTWPVNDHKGPLCKHYTCNIWKKKSTCLLVQETWPQCKLISLLLTYFIKQSETSISLYTFKAIKDQNMQNNNFTSCFVWMWNLVSVLKEEHNQRCSIIKCWRKHLDLRRWSNSNSVLYMTRNFMIYMGHLALLGQWNQGCYNWLNVWHELKRQEVHTEFWWENLLEKSMYL